MALSRLGLFRPCFVGPLLLPAAYLRVRFGQYVGARLACAKNPFAGTKAFGGLGGRGWRLVLGDQSGQAVIEYILLLSVVVVTYVTIASWMSRFGVAQRLARPITNDFARAYQYGDTKAKGFDDEKPQRHARIQDCQDCFRIFINPRYD